MKRSVVIFVPAIDQAGGVERLLHTLVAHLAGQGCAVRVASFVVAAPTRESLARFARVDELHAERNFVAEALALWKYLRSLPREVAWLGFDLKSAFYRGLISTRRPFCLHLTDPPSLLPADVSKFAWTLRARLFPNTKGSLKQRARGQFAHWVTRRGVRRATRTVVMTRRIADEVRALYGIEAVVVRPGVDPAPCEPSRPPPRGARLRLFSASRLEPSKRLDDILRALAAWPRRGEDSDRGEWELEIVGGGSAEADLRELTRALGLESHVVFRGQVSDEDLHDSYSRADLFLMPAVQGYGLPALEALAAGAAVVLHRDSGVSEVLENSAWVSIIDDARDGLLRAMETMARRIAEGALLRELPPTVPTQEAWANQITDLLLA